MTGLQVRDCHNMNETGLQDRGCYMDIRIQCTRANSQKGERERRKTTFYYLIFFPDAVYVQNFKTTCYNQMTFRKHDEGALSRDISFSGKKQAELFLLCFRTFCSLSFFFQCSFHSPCHRHAFFLFFSYSAAGAEIVPLFFINSCQERQAVEFCNQM